MPEDRFGSKIAVERFRQEMSAVGKVNHPNVVSASDAGVVDGQHFLVMELVEGADLARIIRHRGRLNVADACEIVRQAAIGLQHAHDNGLVHRDVKPSNLMLSYEGVVKLLDLGLAAVSHSDSETVVDNNKSNRLTSFGQIMGTLDYIAPEQISDCSKADHRADVYSLGATLFTLLTGKTPHKRTSTNSSHDNENAQEFLLREISDFRNDLPEGLVELINKMLARSVEERPQNAADVAIELKQFSHDAELGSLANECETLLERTPQGTENSSDRSLSVSPERIQSGKSKKTFFGLSKGHVTFVLGIASMVLISTVLFTVFTIKTKRGMLKIELPDGVDASSISVALEKDGETVKIVDEGGNWEVRMLAGEYNIRLLKGDDKFQLEKQTLLVQAKETARLKVTWIPKVDDPVLLFRAGKFEAAAKLAQHLVDRNQNNGWTHVQAAMLWGALSFVGEGQSANPDRYDKHRKWLLSRWRKTGEGTNTIPRACCLFPIKQTELKGMLEAVEQESKVDPSDWRYSHTRMMLLYRMGRYEEALRAYRECRRISPTNRMHAAIDKAWSMLINRQLNRPDEAKNDYSSSSEFFHTFFHPKLVGKFKVPEMWFDFIELGIIHRELDGSQKNDSKEK